MANSKDKQKSVAKHLYMKGTPTAQIVELTGVSRQSVSRWLNTEGWKEERAAREMSKESITSKTLSKLGDAIDKADGDERSIGRMADSLLKSVKAFKARAMFFFRSASVSGLRFEVRRNRRWQCSFHRSSASFFSSAVISV